MGLTKSQLFTSAQNDMALVAKAFSHPARVAILEYLISKNACINGELVEELGLAQATISQHLRELKDIGIIRGTIEGVRLNYCIDPVRWQEIASQFTSMFSNYKLPSGESCC